MCPLCAAKDYRTSWLREVPYQNHSFEYVECRKCHSLFCLSMPDAEMLMKMYGPEYAANTAGADSIDPKNPSAVVAALRSAGAGTFIDFGCGDGKLLVAAQAAGWRCVGVELNPDTAQQIEARTAVPVYTKLSSVPQGSADALHLGDVIEHLTALDTQFPEILALLKPGGCLIAQGPLENNTNLFNTAIRAGHRFKRTVAARPPYHVMLATALGQRLFFERFNLRATRYSITEEHWPAPATPFASPRAAFLFFTRRTSQLLTKIAGRNWGNRYFYVGTTP
jgi:SAM-dependent methyltransferase